MIIQFYKKNVYGKRLNYPVGETLQVFEALTGRKTLTESDFTALAKLDCSFLEVLPPKK